MLWLTLRKLKSKDCETRVEAAKKLGESGSPHAVNPLIAALKDEDTLVRAYARKALGVIGDNRAVEPLIATLEDKEWDVRESTTKALGNIGDNRAVEPLIAALIDWHSGVQKGAMGALEKIDSNWEKSEAAKNAVPNFVQALKDEDLGIRKGAAKALEKIGDNRAVEPLIAALKSHGRKAKKSAKVVIDEAEDVFIVIRNVADRQGKTPIKGIEEKMRVDRKCIYCQYLCDPVFNDPEYPRGGAYCEVENGPTPFDDWCDHFKPTEASPWWLQGECMSGIYPSVSIWWITYSDKERQEREKKVRDQRELLPAAAAQIGVELDPLSSFKKPNLSDICLSPDGRFMTYTYATDRMFEDRKMKMVVWDIQAKKQFLVIPIRGNYTHFCISPNSKFLAATQSFQIVSIWNLQTGKKVNSVEIESGSSMSCLIFTADGRYLVVGHGFNLDIWNIQRNIVNEDRKTFQEKITGFSIIGDGNWLAAETEGGVIYIFDTNTWKEINILRRHDEAAVRLERSLPQRQLLVSIFGGKFQHDIATGTSRRIENGKIKLWDVQEAIVLREFPCHGWGCLNATGQLLAENSDENLNVWDVCTGGKIRTFPMEEGSLFSFSSKAEILVIYNYGKVKLFKVKIKQKKDEQIKKP